MLQIRVMQLCQIGQVYHQMARDAGLVDLATIHTPLHSRMDEGGAGPCCVCLSQLASQQLKLAHLHACPKMQLCRAVRVQLCTFRRRAERPGRPRSCLYVWLTRKRLLVRACAKCVYVYAIQ